MATVTAAVLRERLELADDLRSGRPVMLEPQDLPGRYGRVVQAVDRVLQAIGGTAVLGGGWAVWRHGYIGRVTQDLDVALPAASIAEFLRAASLTGFDVLPVPAGRWPKLAHKDTGIHVDILPEGSRPGTASRPAPTTIPHPARMGASGNILHYIDLPSLVELKLGAGRAKDDLDVIELIRANPEAVEAVRTHLASVHRDYVQRFEELRARLQEEEKPA